MKKLIALLVCAALLLSLTACAKPLPFAASGEPEEPEQNGSTQMANPMVEQSGADAFGALGITMDAPTGASGVLYFIISNTIADVRFTLDGADYTYRASAVETDISGVYDTLTPAFTFDMLNGADTITAEAANAGDSGTLATGSADGGNYSLFARQHVEEPAMRACILSAMQKTYPSITEQRDESAATCLAFSEEKPAIADLDGDGSMEAVTVTVVPEHDYSLEQRTITVTTASGEQASIVLDISSFFSGFACDADGDGYVELFACGDVESCDYDTWLMRYIDGKLVLSASPYDDEDNGDWLPPACSGYVTGIENGVVTVENSVDVLGTWGAKTQYTVASDPFALIRVPGSIWTRDASMLDPEYWDYCTLITTRKLPVTLDGESTPSALETGVKMAILETDDETYAGFVTQDGRKGRISIERDTESWGWKIDGIHETEYFEMVPYAG